MKKGITFALVGVFTLGLLSFTNATEPSKCYINFNSSQPLKRTAPELLPVSPEKIKKLPIANGKAEVSSISGYKVNYLNKKKAPVVTVQVKYSDPASFQKDKTATLQYLAYLNSKGAQKESSVMEMNYNGYTIYGTSSDALEAGSTLGTFVIFPGDNATVYLTFQNSTSEGGAYKNENDYKAQRNAFLGEYTSFLKECHN